MHHANIIINKADCRVEVFDMLKKELDFDTKANPDFLIIEKESFGIDDARHLERWAIGKALVSDTKVSLVIARSMTSEAQNALLKVLEEPAAGTYIFISLENLGGVLPTLISRVRILDLKMTPKEDSEAQKFLISNLEKRLALIRALSKKNPSADGKNEMKDVIKNLEEVAYKNNFKPADLKNVLKAKIFATSRGSSPKMLLEWLSAVV